MPGLRTLLSVVAFILAVVLAGRAFLPRPKAGCPYSACDCEGRSCDECLRDTVW